MMNCFRNFFSSLEKLKLLMRDIIDVVISIYNGFGEKQLFNVLFFL